MNLVLIIIVFLIGWILYVAKTPKDSYLDRIGNHIQTGSGILVAFGVYMTYKFLQYNHHQLTIENTLKTVDRSWLDILKLFESYKDKCPNLINSLFYDYQKDNYNLNLDLTKKDDWYGSVIVSNNIFQNWEDVLTLSVADETGLHVWIAIFLQYTRSPILYDLWNRFKPDYSLTTQKFGDLLFKYTKENTPKNYNEQQLLGNKIYESTEFKLIVEERNDI